MKAGAEILYVPSAVVRHEVEERRLRKGFFLAYHFDYGRALVRMKGMRAPVGIIPRRLISFSDRLLRMLPKKIWWWLRESDPQKRFFNKCHAWATAGEAAELYRGFFAKAAPEVTAVSHQLKQSVE